MTQDLNDIRLPKPRTSQAGPPSLPRVLLVDDEPAVLAGLGRHLRGRFSVSTATNADEALDVVAAAEPFAVVVSDMRMPGKDGAALLAEIRTLQPDATRMLLTGYTEVDAAIAAINQGNVFRFLTKPTTPPDLIRAINDGVEQHRLVIAERELLENTLHGSVRALLDTLALANPPAFSRARRIAVLVSDLLGAMELDDRWEIEVAAALSQLGAVTLPLKVAEKLHAGGVLHEEEQAMVARMPEIADRLLASVPRLEGVRAIIRAQEHWRAADAPQGAKLLRLAQDYDTLEAQRRPADAILATLRESADHYGTPAYAALLTLQSGAAAGRNVSSVGLHDLEVGMVLADDVRTVDGVLLVGRGQTVTESLLTRIGNFAETTTFERDEVAVVLARPHG